MIVINGFVNNNVLVFYGNLVHDGSLYDCLLDSGGLVQSIDKAVIVYLTLGE